MILQNHAQELQWNAKIRTSNNRTMPKAEQLIIRISDVRTLFRFQMFEPISLAQTVLDNRKKLYIKRFRLALNVKKKRSVRSDFEHSNDLLPNQSHLSEIRTRSHFGISLYLSIFLSTVDVRNPNVRFGKLNKIQLGFQTFGFQTFGLFRLFDRSVIL